MPASLWPDREEFAKCLGSIAASRRWGSFCSPLEPEITSQYLSASPLGIIGQSCDGSPFTVVPPCMIMPTNLMTGAGKFSVGSESLSNAFDPSSLHDHGGVPVHSPLTINERSDSNDNRLLRHQRCRYCEQQYSDHETARS